MCYPWQLSTQKSVSFFSDYYMNFTVINCKRNMCKLFILFMICLSCKIIEKLPQCHLFLRYSCVSLHFTVKWLNLHQKRRNFLEHVLLILQIMKIKRINYTRSSNRIRTIINLKLFNQLILCFLWWSLVFDLRLFNLLQYSLNSVFDIMFDKSKQLIVCLSNQIVNIIIAGGAAILLIHISLDRYYVPIQSVNKIIILSNEIKIIMNLPMNYVLFIMCGRRHCTHLHVNNSVFTELFRNVGFLRTTYFVFADYR